MRDRHAAEEAGEGRMLTERHTLDGPQDTTE